MTYLDNILEQPTVLRSQIQTYRDHKIWSDIQTNWQRVRPGPLVLTGMGASFNALYPSWFYLHQQGVPAVHIETSELIHYSQGLIQQRGVMVVVSQSGNSVEIRRLMERVQQQPTAQRPWVISVTTHDDNALAQASDVQLLTQAGPEVGVATKTYTSTLVLLDWLARTLVGQLQEADVMGWDAIATQMEQLLQDWEPWITPAWQQLKHCTYLALVARGPSLASALNGGLILKEAARLPAEGFTGGRFRHGPMELLSPQVGCLVFTPPGRTQALQSRLAQDTHHRGGTLVTVGTAVEFESGDAVDAPVQLTLPPVTEQCSPVLEILSAQLLAAKLAEQQGITPGQFRWSGKVIETE